MLSVIKFHFGGKTYRFKLSKPSCVGESIFLGPEDLKNSTYKLDEGYDSLRIYPLNQYFLLIEFDDSPNGTYVNGQVEFFDHQKLLWSRGGTDVSISEKTKRVLVYQESASYFEIVSFDGKTIFNNDEIGSNPHVPQDLHSVIYQLEDKTNPKYPKKYEVIMDIETGKTHKMLIHYNKEGISGGLRLLSNNGKYRILFKSPGPQPKQWVTDSSGNIKFYIDQNLSALSFIKNGRILAVADYENKKISYLDSESGKILLDISIPVTFEYRQGFYGPEIHPSDDGELILLKVYPRIGYDGLTNYRFENLYIINTAGELLWNTEYSLNEKEYMDPEIQGVSFKDDVVFSNFNGINHCYRFARQY